MIYPQSIQGKFRNIKNLSTLFLLLLYFLGSWIRWDRGSSQPSQAVYMSLENMKAYLFNIEIWPEELYLLAGILILAALGLFFVTSLYGRIWCGYTCPHTVFVELFVKTEKFFQGDRNDRIKLDLEPMNLSKFIKKVSTHSVWIIIAFSFAFGWVCYFYDAPALSYDLLHFQVSKAALGWLGALTLTTYFFAGFIRERVCLYMCPYGRFQSAMLDNDTTVVTYHDYRGEPRGKLNSPAQTGDCIDCNKCVVVCPMGVDIRNGLQIGCINCGLCVDACNSVMEKIGRPLNLIGYDSINSTNLKALGQNFKHKIFHAKTLLFGVLFITVSLLLIYFLITKSPLRLTVMHDRFSLYTQLPDGSVRNSYIMKIFNKSNYLQKYSVSILGINNATIKLQGFNQDYSLSHEIEIEPNQEIEIIIFVRADKEILKTGENTVTFLIRNIEDNKIFTTTNTFVSN